MTLGVRVTRTARRSDPKFQGAVKPFLASGPRTISPMAKTLDQIPENFQITLDAAKDALGLKSTREVRNRIKEGRLDWMMAPNPRPGPKTRLVVDLRSLPNECREAHARSIAKQRMESSRFFKAHKAQEPTPRQGDLFLGELADQMSGAYEQKRVAEFRLKLITPVANGLYRRLGYETKGGYLKTVAAEHKVSVRSLQRWWDTYRDAGAGVRGLQALMNDAPGPEPTGPNLEPWVKLFLDTERLVNRSTREAGYQNLLAEVAARQAAHGVAHIYQQPKRSACYSYWASLGKSAPIAAALEGRSAIKAAAMQISRTYADCYSLDRVGVDEWIVDVLAYDPNLLIYPKTHKKRGQPRVGRYYLVTMLDERSLFPLDAVLCEMPNRDDEIDLLVNVCQNYGVPGLINSDRGRFRGRVFGGEFRQIDRAKISGALDGILDRLGISRNMPRQHNPQGNRLERFHLELARFTRTLPGWVGADTEERQELSDGDAQQREHEEWIRGKRPSTPLLSRDELLDKFREFFRAWREDHQSDGTDMQQLTPQMVFERNRHPEGFSQVSREDLDRLTARVYHDRLVQTAGLIEISEGNYVVTKYYSHELLFIQGQRRTVLRSRTDRSRITVLGARPGEKDIIAPVMPRVGTADPELLSQAIAEKTFSGHIIQAVVSVRRKTEDRTSVPRSIDRINPDELLDPGSVISSSEWMMTHAGRAPVTSEEVARRAIEIEEEPAPSLYDYGECKAE